MRAVYLFAIVCTRTCRFFAIQRLAASIPALVLLQQFDATLAHAVEDEIKVPPNLENLRARLSAALQQAKILLLAVANPEHTYTQLAVDMDCNCGTTSGTIRAVANTCVPFETEMICAREFSQTFVLIVLF